MIPLIALVLCSLGIAADSRAEVLFSSGEASDAVQDVRRALGEGGEHADLAVQNLHDVLGENPSVIGGGSVERCANPPLSPYVPGADADALTSRLAEVQALIDGGNLDKAIQSVRVLANLVPCSRDPLDAKLARTIFFKQGYIAALLADSNPTRASAYMGESSTSYGLWRQLTPDDRQALDAVATLATVEGKDLALAQVKLRVTSNSLQVRPVVKELWIDGVVRGPDETVRMSVGKHLVQLRPTAGAPVQSMWVTLKATEPAMLAVPSLVPDDVLDWVELPARRADLSGLLAAVSAGDIYIVTSGGEVWRGVAREPGSWAPVVPQRVVYGGLQKAGRITTITGLSVAGASVVALGSSCIAGRRSAAPYPSEFAPTGLTCGYSEQETSLAVFQASRGALISGMVLANAGFGLFVAGGDARLSLMPTPGGALLRVGWGQFLGPRYPL